MPLEWAADWADHLEAPPLGPFDLVVLGGVVLLAYHYAGELGRRPTAEQQAGWDDLERELCLLELTFDLIDSKEPKLESDRTKARMGYVLTPADDYPAYMHKEYSVKTGKPVYRTSPAFAEDRIVDENKTTEEVMDDRSFEEHLLGAYACDRNATDLTRERDRAREVYGRYSGRPVDLPRLLLVARRYPEMLRQNLLRADVWNEKDIDRFMQKLEYLNEESKCIQMKAGTAATFAAFDKNRDGVISKDELIAIFHRLDPHGQWTGSRLNALFAAMDRNSDHVVDYTEFVEFIFAAGTGVRITRADTMMRDNAHEAIARIADLEMHEPHEKVGQRSTEASSTWRFETGTDKYVYRVRGASTRDDCLRIRLVVATVSLEAGVVSCDKRR